ncbi:MAG: CoA transferase [Dehalococcoidia bacterium]|nr:CoA transferase [Dehalococcoidia bacterium]
MKKKRRRSRVLEGIKVLDFSWVLVVPLATRYLADYGAEVIKIESTTQPDLGRVTSPFKDGVPGFERNVLFGWGNGSKKSICLNLRHPDGRDLAKRLARWADVITESFAPGVMESWGLCYDELRKVNPSLIMLSGSVFGQTGPCRKHPGFGWNINALAGFTELTGWPDREAAGPNVAYPDLIAPWFAIVSLLAAIDYRRRTGRGQYIDLAQFEASLLFLSPTILDYTVNRRIGGRIGNRCPYAAPHGVFKCRGQDRWCAIAVTTDEEWQRFSAAIGNPLWSAESRFSTLRARISNSEELDLLVEQWTTRYSPEEVMQRMQTAGVPCGVVKNARDLLEDPQLEARGHFQLVNHPVVGSLPHAGWPAHLAETPAEYVRAPLLGEHTEYVCSKILGLSDDELARLIDAGVLC